MDGENRYSGIFVLERKRVQTVFEAESANPLVTVIAGAGFGKTQAMISFLCHTDKTVVWHQFSVRDNLAARFWDDFIKSFGELGGQSLEKLRFLDFPETGPKFDRFLLMLIELIKTTTINFLVFDDVHVLYEKSVLVFLERLANATLPNCTIFLLSRSALPFNVMGQKAKGRLGQITEEQLAFTKEEVDAYFSGREIKISPQLLKDVYEISGGWIAAIYLIALSFRRGVQYSVNPYPALQGDLHKMIEQELFLYLSPEMKKFACKLSLLERLPADFLNMFSQQEKYLVEEFVKISSFVRYDVFSGNYYIHRILQDYLVGQQKNWLSEKEIKETYLAMACWCIKNERAIDAISYSEKAGDYELVVSIILSRGLRCPVETANYFVEVLERAPRWLYTEKPIIEILKARAYLNNFMIEKAHQSLKTLQAQYEKMPNTSQNRQMLGETYVLLGLIDLVLCFETNQYDFLRFFKRASELLPEGSTVIDKEIQFYCGDYVCLVRTPIAGQIEKAVQAAEEAMPNITHLMHGGGYGMGPLGKAEYFYLLRNFKEAEKNARQAMLMAREKNQKDVELTAIFYMMKISLAFGEFEELERLLARMKEIAEKARDSYKVMQNIFEGWYYVQIGEYDKISPWILDFQQSKEMTSPITFALDHLVRAKYQYANGNYYELLAELEEQKGLFGLQAYLVGAVDILLIKAATFYRLDEKESALRNIEEAYRQAVSNGLIMPFIELGASMRTLAQFAQNAGGCSIPVEWLEDIKRKSSTYAKKLAYIGNYYKRFTKDDSPHLTKKELEMLKNICRGLTREEIATECDLSINTVKSMLRMIYSKLGAANSYDAIRIAAQLGLEL